MQATRATMNTYLIDPRGNGGDPFTVEAESHGGAATAGARRIFPDLKRGTALRETGDPSGSGMFLVWYTLRGSTTQTSHGKPFHVMEL